MLRTFFFSITNRKDSICGKKHFLCDCENHFGTFEIKCSHHEMFFERFDDKPGKCKCEESKPSKICIRCITKMFILNHIVYKVCVATPPFQILAKMKILDDYLKEFPSEAFFLRKKLER